MLKRLYIDNFLCLVNFELTLDETNVLLGPNGSGKTSVLRALHRIQGLVARGTRLEEMFPTDHLSLTQDRNEQRFELDVELDGNSYRYVLGVEHDRDRRCMQISEERLVHNDRMLFEFKDGNAQLYNDDYTEGPAYPFDSSRSGVGAMNARSDNRKLTRFKQELAKFIIASPCPPLFKSESRTEDGFLHPMIENFVGWYRHVAQENMGSIAELFATLRDVLPGFGSINLTEAGRELTCTEGGLLSHPAMTAAQSAMDSASSRMVSEHCLRCTASSFFPPMVAAPCSWTNRTTILRYARFSHGSSRWPSSVEAPWSRRLSFLITP